MFRPFCRSGLARIASFLLLAARFLLAGDAAGSSLFRPPDPLNASAFERYYNLDYDAAVQDFEKILDRHPTDPFAVNHLLAAVQVRELYRMGAMNSGEYANDSFIGQAHRSADPQQRDRIRKLIQQAERLEDAALARDPNDVDALYARGVTRGQFALYTALIERAWLSSLRNAVGARRDHERVLQLAPQYTDAKLIVGAHNYVTGSLSFAVKMAVSLAGLGGDKEKGLQYLRQAYQANGETGVDAGVVLMVFLRREHRYGEALQIAEAIGPRFPRNYLLPLEEANLLRAAGKKEEAEQKYRQVWQAGREGKYGNLHYEMAALGWGDLLRSEKRYQAAATAYEQLGEVTGADPEMVQKANLGAGEMYDQLRNRDMAVKKYEAVVAVNSGNAEAENARKRLKYPYRE